MLFPSVALVATLIVSVMLALHWPDGGERGIVAAERRLVAEILDYSVAALRLVAGIAYFCFGTGQRRISSLRRSPEASRSRACQG